jgi:hypothetical protein
MRNQEKKIASVLIPHSAFRMTHLVGIMPFIGHVVLVPNNHLQEPGWRGEIVAPHPARW